MYLGTKKRCRHKCISMFLDAEDCHLLWDTKVLNCRASLVMLTHRVSCYMGVVCAVHGSREEGDAGLEGFSQQSQEEEQGDAFPAL